MSSKMAFGTFLAPYHRIGENPMLAIRRDMELIEWCDYLGLDEAWIGEHHSAGWETISDPLLIIAALADKTKTIRLGSGVMSLPYHQPLMLADRFVQLDYMTRGRVMFGAGPGALMSDALMMGIAPLSQRQHMDEALGAIIRLLDGETVTYDSEFFHLHEARLQMLPLHGKIPVFVASTFSPAGAVTAGKYGAGVLSLGAGFAGSKKDLVGQWALGEETAAEHGKTLRRKDWRIVLRVHLSDTHEQALADVQEGWSYEAKTYFAWGKKDRTLQDEIDNDTALVGTPDEVIAQIERIQEETGGFGGLLVLAHEWATREKTLHSYELLARYVMPHFNGMFAPLAASWDATVARGKANKDDLVAVVSKAFVDAGKPVPEDMSIGNLR